jgi:cell division septation protein DedD
MILRTAIVFLLMLNLGVAAWWLLGGPDLRAAPPASVADNGQPGLRLVDEPVAAPPPAAPATSAPPSMILATVPARPAPAGQPAAAPAPMAATAVCVSFGPFADAAARDAVRPRLQALREKLVPRDAEARAARGWRVYMPALASRDAAQEVVDRIKAAGINDWYIIANGSEANSIALGRYGSEESARKRQAQLAGKGFSARAEPLGDTPPQWWLDARFPADASRATLAAIAPSRPLDCARLQ